MDSFKAYVARLNCALNVRRKKSKTLVIGAPTNVVKNGLPFVGYSPEDLAMRDEIMAVAASKSALSHVEEIVASPPPPPYCCRRTNSSCVSLDKGLVRVTTRGTLASATSPLKKGGRTSRRRILSFGGRDELEDKETTSRLVDLTDSPRYNHNYTKQSHHRRPYRFGDSPMSFHPVMVDSDEPFFPSGLTSPSSSSSLSSIRCVRD